jgi:hypothetical protein
LNEKTTYTIDEKESAREDLKEGMYVMVGLVPRQVDGKKVWAAVYIYASETNKDVSPRR